MSWKINIFTLFPEMFPGTLGYGLAQKSFKNKIWDFSCINFRDYATDIHKTVDDTPYGGGAGMVIKPDVLGEALDNNYIQGTPIYYLSPRGQLFNMKVAEELISFKEVNFVCGRYEGIDHRLIEHYNMIELSVGDYILSGGEVALQTVLDACIRLLPNVLGNSQTHEEESFMNSLLEYPHYTRPKKWKNLDVPAVLCSGNHKNINEWRMDQAMEMTKQRRPDLWEIYKNNKN